MLGMFQENGPFTIDTEGLGIIAENPHPWNARANVIYLEQPVGVGFSFGNATTDYIHSDMSQSADTVLAMVSFYDKFPELMKNDLYISGESYGGIYVPTLTW